MENNCACCMGKLNEYYCIRCLKVYHLSCLNKLKDFILLAGHKIYCSQGCKDKPPETLTSRSELPIELDDRSEVETERLIHSIHHRIEELERDAREKDGLLNKLQADLLETEEGTLSETNQMIIDRLLEKLKEKDATIDKLNDELRASKMNTYKSKDSVSFLKRMKKPSLRTVSSIGNDDGDIPCVDENGERKRIVAVFGDESAEDLTGPLRQCLSFWNYPRVMNYGEKGCTRDYIVDYIIKLSKSISMKFNAVVSLNLDYTKWLDMHAVDILSSLGKHVYLFLCIKGRCLIQLYEIKKRVELFNIISRNKVVIICEFQDDLGYEYRELSLCDHLAAHISHPELSSQEQIDVFKRRVFELREIKRKQEAAQAEERARREKEEAERLAALAAAQPKEIEQITTDRPDSSAQAVEERPVHGERQPRPMTLPTPTSSPSPKSPRSQTLSRSEEKVKRKDRSRSKSPFRSFRWKRSSKASGTHSDDEGASGLTATSTEPGSVGDEEGFEGTLVRKHEWENTTTKSTNRSWDKVYCVLKGSQLSFYKDNKTAKSTPDQRFKGEAPLTLLKAVANVAQDYKKKKHVFRLKLESGGEFLFQAHDDSEMNTWISNINSHADVESSGPSRSHTLPASAQKEDSKRRSFFTLKKT